MKKLTVALTVVVAAFFPIAAVAQVYKWVDKDGVTHYGNNPYAAPQDPKISVEKLKIKEAPRQINGDGGDEAANGEAAPQAGKGQPAEAEPTAADAQKGADGDQKTQPAKKPADVEKKKADEPKRELKRVLKQREVENQRKLQQMPAPKPQPPVQQPQ